MATEHGDRDDSRVHTTGADENGSEEHVKSGPHWSPDRAGPWNSQCEKFAQSIMLAARLGGGGNITFRYGGMVAEVEIKHSKAAEPELVQRTREVRLEAVALQAERLQSVKRAAAEKAAAKKAKRERQKERKRMAKEQQEQQPEAEQQEQQQNASGGNAEAATLPAEVPAHLSPQLQKLQEKLAAEKANNAELFQLCKAAAQQNRELRGERTAGQEGLAPPGLSTSSVALATSSTGGISVESRSKDANAVTQMDQG